LSDCYALETGRLKPPLGSSFVNHGVWHSMILWVPLAMSIWDAACQCPVPLSWHLLFQALLADVVSLSSAPKHLQASMFCATDQMVSIVPGACLKALPLDGSHSPLLAIRIPFSEEETGLHRINSLPKYSSKAGGLLSCTCHILL
jgi:hypothetical protein